SDQLETDKTSVSAWVSVFSRRLDAVAILAFAVLIAVLAGRIAFFQMHNDWIDELGLFNPVYMFVHYGKMTYPVYAHFDEMVVHPPTHYALIGGLMKLGLNVYFAESIPSYAFTLLILLLVCRGSFPNAIKLGLLLGIFSAVMLLYCNFTNL